jgi:inorganic pyrophosphatase
MTNYLELPTGQKAPEVINAVIEIPDGAVNKYEYDKTLHVFRLDRNLYSPVHYPGDYGFIPSTLSEDGDPLDVLVLVDSPSFAGCVMDVRPIGVLKMLDQGIPDEKVLAVGRSNPRYADVWNYTEIYPHMLREITHFFSIYKDLEGKRMTHPRLAKPSSIRCSAFRKGKKRSGRRQLAPLHVNAGLEEVAKR